MGHKSCTVSFLETGQAVYEQKLKLRTGQSKTLTGLLILQSRINEGTGASIYLCPDYYLVEQTCIEADAFEFKYTVYDGDIPDDYTDDKAVLIMNIQTLFNGLTKFGFGRKFVEASTISRITRTVWSRN